jgi:hypothetical protein
MAESDKRDDEICAGEGPQSTLERKYVAEYLQSRGYRLEDVQRLDKTTAQQLMREACRYAALKLAELEAKGHLRKKIHF